jgi:hypothetical protein
MRDLPSGAADDVLGGSNIRCQMFSLTYCSERVGCRTSPLHDISTSDSCSSRSFATKYLLTIETVIFSSLPHPKVENILPVVTNYVYACACDQANSHLCSSIFNAKFAKCECGIELRMILKLRAFVNYWYFCRVDSK